MYMSKTIPTVFLGCCVNSLLMEILMSAAPHSANLITFLQFFFNALHGFIFTSKFGTVKPKVPIFNYTILVLLFFASTVLNNYVYTLHVPSTLHMIIRSASSPASMLVSWYFKSRKPQLTKAIGSFLISFGVILAMYGGASVAENNEGTFLYWCLGVTILLVNLFTGAFTGLQQENLYAKYGKNSEEALYYTHLIPLPLFLAISPQLRDTASGLRTDLWVLIVLNILTQFLCASAVHELATRETSVTVTLILTLRRFLSLIISSLVFKSNLTVFHVVGTLFVIYGTYIYFDRFKRRQQLPVELKQR